MREDHKYILLAVKHPEAYQDKLPTWDDIIIFCHGVGLDVDPRADPNKFLIIHNNERYHNITLEKERPNSKQFDGLYDFFVQVGLYNELDEL